MTRSTSAAQRRAGAGGWACTFEAQGEITCRPRQRKKRRCQTGVVVGDWVAQAEGSAVSVRLQSMMSQLYNGCLKDDAVHDVFHNYKVHKSATCQGAKRIASSLNTTRCILAPRTGCRKVSSAGETSKATPRAPSWSPGSAGSPRQRPARAARAPRSPSATMHGSWGMLQTLLCGLVVGCPPLDRLLTQATWSSTFSLKPQ